MHDDPEWAGLRRRLRDRIAWKQASRLEVARALGIGFAELVRVLGSDTAVPDRQVIGWAYAFLVDQGPAVTATPSGNGAASAPNRLSEAERDKLLGYLELTSRRQVRRELRMSVELASAAAAGTEIPPEAVERINAFFEAAPG